MKALPSYVVVTPVRDEVRHIEATLAAVGTQTHLPAHWVIVDDGSSDGTGALLDRHPAGVSWIDVIHRPDRGRRAPGGGVMDAFHAGLDRLTKMPWDFLVKLDGDLSFEPEYFARCLAHFAAEPALGIGGGTVCVREPDGRLRVESVGDPLFHVRGATKIYRRACWEQIAPLPRTPGWDTVDEVCANWHGWRTRSFGELTVVQHKPTGSADGCWANAFKNGRANYLTGYHPAFMLAKCVKRVRRAPLGVEAAGLFAGFVSGYWKRLPRSADGETVRYLRRQQVRRMLLRPSIYG
jgi:poly-beta-1,6-N-acetyl-D-glucosamine synthase